MPTAWKGAAKPGLWEIGSMDWISIDQMKPTGTGLLGAAVAIDLMVPSSTVWTEGP